jgi:hypothetical protein
MSENTMATMPRLSVSTWSLHRALGRPALYGPEDGIKPTSPAGKSSALSLLDLPDRLNAIGLSTLEICHFHLPTLDQGYLSELRTALEQAHIELFSLLIDDGDITHPTHGSRDLAWITSWIAIAGQLGARCVRVIAGKSQPTEETLQRSAQGLSHVMEHADTWGIRVMTENWFSLLSRPAAVHDLLKRLEGRVGLCFDFGNWRGPTKYEDLRSIAPFAESCHTKAYFSPTDGMDKDDYMRCLDITQAAGFAGPYTLIYDGPNEDEWAGIASEREVVLPYLRRS